ncbi:MAG: type II secretion system protein [Verrucomicrobia bacterium]|nr:type II secretion system protein [Verrucomicrobiota bacterium]
MRTTHLKQFTVRRERAFTMIEIAISLAIIGFALVAIIGVLPTGLTAQKENREETIINQDGPYFLELIRNGSQGMDDLLNNVDAIGVVTLVNDTPTFDTNFDYYANLLNPAGSNIVGLLSLPYGKAFGPSGGAPVTSVIARVRALSGAAVETGGASKDFAFAYQITTEVIPLDWGTNATEVAAVVAPLIGTDHFEPYTNALSVNLYEVRVICQWPLLPSGAPGPNRKVFRAMVSGKMNHDHAPLSFFTPRYFQDRK